MDATVTELRAHLSEWIDLVRDGNEVVVTDRGTPVARMIGMDATPVIDRLTNEGIISRPAQPTRPIAGAKRRPRPSSPVADIISEQRR
jgi:prevent-host-death family protein